MFKLIIIVKNLEFSYRLTLLISILRETIIDAEVELTMISSKIGWFN